jgi:transposase
LFADVKMQCPETLAKCGLHGIALIVVHYITYCGIILFTFGNSFAVGEICGYMSATQTISDKQYLAKILFTREQLEQKVVAKKVGVTEKTISKWVNDFEWKKLRNRLLLSKDEQISFMYEELEEISNKIKSKEAGERFADTKQADIRIKTTAAIRNLETDLGIHEIVDVGIKFIKFLQKAETIEVVMQINDLWHSFIQFSIKNR